MRSCPHPLASGSLNLPDTTVSMCQASLVEQKLILLTSLNPNLRHFLGSPFLGLIRYKSVLERRKNLCNLFFFCNVCSLKAQLQMQRGLFVFQNAFWDSSYLCCINKSTSRRAVASTGSIWQPWPGCKPVELSMG